MAINKTDRVRKRSIRLRLPGDPLLQVLSDLSRDLQTPLYLVGGYVRDLLLHREVKDIDIMAAGSGIAAARAFAEKIGARNVVTYEKFGTAMVKSDDRMIEFVGARKEKYLTQTRRPQVESATVDEDLSRRDFTVNAIAVALHPEEYGKLLDPFNGRADLKRKLLRTPLDPDETFDDDPLRMMRAIRFAAQLGFSIEKHTYEGIRRNRDRIGIVSQERITDELMKILASEKPSIGLSAMFDTGLLHIVFPELASLKGVDQTYEHHHKDVFNHTLEVVDNISPDTGDISLRIAALLHDIAKPKTKQYHPKQGWTFHGHEELGARMVKSIFRKLKLPSERIQYIESLISLHLRPMALVDEGVTDSAVRRLLFEAGEHIDDLMKLCRADITSKNPRRVRRYLNNYNRLIQRMKEVEEKDKLRNWQPPVRGDEIMQRFGLSPGKLVGLLKKSLEDAILDGVIPNEYDAAITYLDQVKDKIIREYEARKK